MRARTIARKAPKAAASVGVITPVKMVPNTRPMMITKGSKSQNTVNFSLVVNFTPVLGANLGLRITRMVTVMIKNILRMIPGMIPPAKSRATETSCHPP
jgi:hypothetical protein